MKTVSMIVAGSLAMLAAAEHANATCKLIINVDRTASMTETRADGQTKCSYAQNSVMLILDAYWRGLDFNLLAPGLGAQVRTEFEGSCPAGASYQDTAGTRLVQVREFRGDVMAPLWVGFIPVDTAYQYMVNTSGWYDATGLSLNSCPGSSTPLAQALCRSARTFPLSVPAGDVHMVKTTTDGQENYSDLVPIDAGETRCRNTGETDVVWQNRVVTEYTSRGIIADTALWDTASGGALRRDPRSIETVAEARGYAIGNTSPARNAVGSPDYNFFTALATSTGGKFQYVAASTPVSSALSLVDSDGDGIPDFRDLCVGTCATDSDHDGIPDANDACPFLAEDGHAPARTDGCPDTDSDGIRNGLDQCPMTADDHLLPFPNDGCPAAHWTITGQPALKTIDNGTACTSLTVTSSSGAASLAKLNISGTHTYRSSLRGTLAHNGTTVTAFPLSTFASGSGAFSFTNRPIAMPAGAANGTWTLCIIDADAFGDTGVLSSWSIHD